MTDRPRRHTNSNTTPARIRAASALIAAALLIGGCAAPGARTGEGLSPLERLAQRQIDRPATQTTTATPPQGLDLTAIDPSADPRARASLDAALDHFAQAPLPASVGGAEAHPPAAVSEQDRDEALRRYIAGRSALVGGDVQEAIARLDEASQYDPNEPSIWRTLADAHWISGDRLAAYAAYAQTIRLEPGDTVSLMRIGLSEFDRGSRGAALALLARAHNSLTPDGAIDAAIPYLVNITLGRALQEEGWLGAGNEAMLPALDELASFAQPTSYARELSAVIRGAGDTWRDAGDASVRIGSPREALEAYARASELPSFDPAALLTRRVYANMLLGRPARAAMLLVNRISELKGLVDDRTLELIRYCTGVSDVGSALAEEIGRVQATLTSDEQRIAASQLARAQAAALPDAEAVAALTRRVSAVPQDEAAVSDLLNRRPPDDDAGLVELVAGLIEANTIEAPRYAAALTRYCPDPDALLDASRRGDSLGALLLSAILSAERGDTENAQRSLTLAAQSRPGDPGVTLAQAGLVIDSGDADRARALLGSIDIDANPAAALGVAKAWRSVGDAQRALEILNDRVWSGEATAEIAQTAGETSLALGSPVDAEQLFRLAIELDPTLEEAYAGLITLYQSTGPLASQANLSDTLRALREAVPSSRTLRWLRVQDLLRADRLDQAQRELLELASASPDAIVVDQLVSVWLRTDQARAALDWLSGRLQRHPNNPQLVRLRARVLAAMGDTDSAITQLRSWLDQRPGDDDASRELENIFRLESVDRQDEADSLAMTRLERAAPSLSRSIELATVLARRQRVADAIAILDEPLTQDLPIAPALLPGYAELVGRVTLLAADPATGDPATATNGLALLDRFIDRFPESPHAMRQLQIALLVQTGAEPDRIARAAVASGEAFPDAADDFTIDAAQRLSQIGKADTALDVVNRACTMMSSPSPRLMGIWLFLALQFQQADTAMNALTTIERLHAAVDSAQALGVIDSRLRFPNDGNESNALAELAFTAANFFAGGDDQDTTDRFYELALRHNPRHAMANNNLAYSWVERDINLDQAHEMLVIAFEEEPGSEAIVDSLGWVRYKLGMIDDQRDAQGRIIMQGAVSLLTSAANISKGPESAEILNHLGDALWRFGRSDDAIKAWNGAREQLRGVVNRQNVTPGEADVAMLANVEAKLDAVAAGEIPPLTPMLRPRRWMQGEPGQDQNNNKPEHQGAPQ